MVALKNKFNKIWQIIIILLITCPFNKVLAIAAPGARFKNLADQAGYNVNTASDKLTVILNVIAYALGFVGLFFLIMIVYAGFQWITAGGNEDTIAKAKTRLKNSVIGFVVIAVAYALVIFVVNFWQVGLSNRYL